MSEKFTLRDILSLYSTEGLPDRWDAWDDIRPNSAQ